MKQRNKGCWNSMFFSTRFLRFPIWFLVPLPFLNPALLWWYLIFKMFPDSFCNDVEQYLTCVRNEWYGTVVSTLPCISFLWPVKVEHCPFPIFRPFFTSPNLIAKSVDDFNSFCVTFLQQFCLDIVYSWRFPIPKSFDRLFRPHTSRYQVHQHYAH